MIAVTYLELCKPRLLPLVLFSAAPALLMADAVSPTLALATLVGTALAAGAANTLNSYLERDTDALMERTRTRPLPAGALPAGRALVFGLGLALCGTGTLLAFTGPAAAAIALAAILFYVFAYTLWLKPRSRFGVLAGGVSGAIAPLIADAAVDGQVGAAGILLFAIVFVWQPPHFYAITLYRRHEYERAGFQMLPSRIGDEATRRRILAWVAAAVVPVSLLTALWTPLGSVYATAALGLGGWLLFEALRLVRQGGEEAAWRFFRVTLGYLVGLFGAMFVDLAVAAVIS